MNLLCGGCSFDFSIRAPARLDVMRWSDLRHLYALPAQDFVDAYHVNCIKKLRRTSHLHLEAACGYCDC